MVDNAKSMNHGTPFQIFSRRLIVSIVIINVFVLLIAFKLVHLQVISHDQYTTLSNNNQITINPIHPNRGLIYDRNGVLIADNLPIYNLELIPERVIRLDDTITNLQNFIDIEDSDIENFYKLLRQRRHFEPITLRSGLTEEEVARFAVEQHDFPGVLVSARLFRYYPLGPDLVHVLGYVSQINEQELQQIDPINYRATNMIGKLGIEKNFEDSLHGTVGYESIETDASGRTIRVLERTPPVPGSDVYLTIDSKLQKVAEEAIGDRRGAVVAIDPQTGEVLALVSVPSYDPNLFVHGISRTDYNELIQSPDKPLYNRSIRGKYPLASTIKPFLAAAALDSQVVTKEYRIHDSGSFRLPNSSYTYRDWKKTGHGWVNASRAIIISCDTYFYNLAHLMGIEELAAALKSFGFGAKTGIEIAEELPGLVPTPEWKRAQLGTPWYPGETVISGIGQGYLLTTPLQLATATAALANRGKRVRPRLVLKTIDSTGNTTYATTKVLPPLTYQPQSWDTVHQAMQDVLTQGTGRRFSHELEYTLAGKTGTAQVFSSQHHEHLDDDNLPEHLQDHSLFIAFAPAEDPQIAVAVIIEHSKLAGEVARKVIDHYLLPPEEPTETDDTTDDTITESN